VRADFRTASQSLLQSNDFASHFLQIGVFAQPKSCGICPKERRPNRLPTLVNQRLFFVRLGKRIRGLRIKRSHSQEDMISYGFSARHWQQIETGRPITVSTLLRICAVFDVSLEHLVRGLDNGIYNVRDSNLITQRRTGGHSNQI